MGKTLFNRYLWLLDTIYRSNGITYEQINERWLNSKITNNEDIPLRTFHHHLDAIKEMFDVEIICNKKGGYKYYIDNIDEIENDSIKSWLLSSFSINSVLNESVDIRDKMILENIPSGSRFLTGIIEALKDCRRVEMVYAAYYHNEPKIYLFNPYCIKIFKQRWYVYGLECNYGKVLTLSLDRIKALKILAEKFEYPKDFNPTEYFNLSYGVIVDDHCQPQTIGIKVERDQSGYLIDLPLHHSQKLIKETEDFFYFEYYLRPTYDFYREILSMGSNVEVLYPDSFRKDISDTAKEMMEIYFPCKK